MNFDAMLLPELKSEAKSRGLKGYSTMKKADLIQALTVDTLAKAAESEPKKASPVLGVESRVHAIKAAIRNTRDARKLAGVAAGREAKVSATMSPGRKAAAYMDSRSGNGTTCNKLTAKQARRIRKTYNKLGALQTRFDLIG